MEHLVLTLQPDKGSGLGNMTLDIDGFSQRFSASLIESEQGTITLDATGTTGTVNVGDLSASGAITIHWKRWSLLI